MNVRTQRVMAAGNLYLAERKREEVMESLDLPFRSGRRVLDTLDEHIDQLRKEFFKVDSQFDELLESVSLPDAAFIEWHEDDMETWLEARWDYLDPADESADARSLTQLSALQAMHEIEKKYEPLHLPEDF